MSVAKRPDGRYRARYRGADGKERSSHHDRKVDAERWVTDQKSRVNNGLWLDPALGRITVGQWSKTWVASKQSLKPSARRSYEEVYKNLVEPHWAERQLIKVTYGDVITWMAELAASGLSASRRRQALLVMKQILDLAVVDGRIARNVAKLVKAPRPIRGEQRFLSHVQLADLAAECGPDFEAFVLLLGYTGLRWGEARALRVRHVDLMRCRIEIAENIPDGFDESETVTPKSHRRRVVPRPRWGSEQLELSLERVRPCRPCDWRWSVHPAQPQRYRCESRCERWGEREGGDADARSCVGGDDA
jgi:integrase